MTKQALMLEAGKLYQVKHWEKGWIIAEYVKEIAAHSYKYTLVGRNNKGSMPS